MNTEIDLIKPRNSKELRGIVEFYSKRYPDDSLNWVDVSGITDMSYMFYKTKYNGDISEWDVSNVTNMTAMFMNSIFNHDISKWDVSHVTDMSFMFTYSIFNQDIS